MAVSIVQCVANDNGSGSSGSSPVSCTISSTSAANCIVAVVFFSSSSSTTCTVTDSASQSYATAGTDIQNTGGSFFSAACRYKEGSASGITTVTASFGAANTSAVMYVFELAGVPASGVYDTGVGQAQNTVTSWNAGTLVTAAKGIILVMANDSASAGKTFTAGAGFSNVTGTGVTSGSHDNTGSGESCYMEYQITTTAYNGSTNGTVSASILTANIARNFLAAVGPSILTQPGDAQVIEQQQTATFSVSASSSGGALSYQWQDNRTGSFANVVDGTGGTSATYTTPTQYVSASGRLYQCIVTDSNGSITTRAATLFVVPLNYQEFPFRIKQRSGGMNWWLNSAEWW